MNECYILEGLKVSSNLDSVMLLIDCKKDSPIYEEMTEEYEELWPEMLELAEPVGIIGFGVLPELGEECVYPAGTRVIYAVTSVGDGIKQCSTQAFAQGDYVRGMLCDAIADAALFSMEDQVQENLKKICGDHGVGIVKRLEAPQDIPMGVQKAAWDTLQLKQQLGIKISSGYMFDPVKTTCQVYVITDDAAVFHAQHDCRNCPNVNCKLRNIPDVPVQVQRGTQRREILIQGGESLMNALLREGYYISAVCGGRGRCGKCRIRVLEGNAVVTAEDKLVFSLEELEAGWRLSCMQYPTEPLVISFELNDETEFEVVSSYANRAQSGENMNPASKDRQSEENTNPANKSRQSGENTNPADKSRQSGENMNPANKSRPSEENMNPANKDRPSEENANPANKDRQSAEITNTYQIAIDIGTTTLALELLEAGTGNPVCEYAMVNSQRQYGADVIARIQAATEGRGQALQDCIREDLRNGISILLQKADISLEQITKVLISGNTTMGHLLMGYDCSGLGVYPFTPVEIGLIKSDLEQLLQLPQKTEVVLLPGISTYVGADIVSGLYACGFDEREELSLLVDLGTNGEMALGSKDKILVTSTAAGPAFEGGNIKWGMGSVAGAICSVKLDGDQAQIKTIRDKAPIGICGTGVLEMTAELLREELIDETGLLEDAYFEDGFPIVKTEDGRSITFTQKDVREIQLAKAAVRAGVETLILRYGVKKEQISRVYLAGGFGYRLDTEKAIAIGMLPEEFAGKITAVGNSSLSGAAKCVREAAGCEKMQQLIRKSEEIELSSDKAFQEFYMDAMYFE